jgi:hypothetical protein
MSYEAIEWRKVAERKSFYIIVYFFLIYFALGQNESGYSDPFLSITVPSHQEFLLPQEGPAITYFASKPKKIGLWATVIFKPPCSHNGLFRVEKVEGNQALVVEMETGAKFWTKLENLIAT